MFARTARSASVLIAVSFGIGPACDDTSPVRRADTIQSGVSQRRVILFLWDGLAPGNVNMTDTPNLWALKSAGAYFTAHHSTYPTFTMVNSGSFATGALPGFAGVYDNIIWQPGPMGVDATGQRGDYRQTIELNDYAILRTLNDWYGGHLLLADTLFGAAQQAGLVTAAIGKTGAAYLQDYREGGFVLDEKMAWPLSLVTELQAVPYPLPRLTPFAYPPGTVTLAPNNGDPTAALATSFMTDGVTSDPTASSTSPFRNSNQYMLKIYLNYILPTKLPAVSFIWFKDPDGTQHNYGVGTAAALDALHSEDAFLGQLLAKLDALGIRSTTDVLILSDHGHSNYSGPLSLFPLRSIVAGNVGAVDPNGYSVSGEVRPADLLSRAGFRAFDGKGCKYSPVLSGIKADGTLVYPTQIDADGSLCGLPAGRRYTTGNFTVPASLPPDAVVVAPNGGSDVFHVPSADPSLVESVVRFLQSREEYGAIFVNDRYGNIPGTMHMSVVRIQDLDGRTPDIVASYNFDADAVIQGAVGTEFGTVRNFRGGHGSFSSVDVHNVMVAAGPDFRAGFVDTLATSNADVAPTVAHILGLPLPGAEGRPLIEALVSGPAVSDFISLSTVFRPTPAVGLVMKLPTNPDGLDIDPSATTFTFELLTTFILTSNGGIYTYFDSARPIRQ